MCERSRDNRFGKLFCCWSVFLHQHNQVNFLNNLLGDLFPSSFSQVLSIPACSRIRESSTVYGNYTWPETTPSTIAKLYCFYNVSCFWSWDRLGIFSLIHPKILAIVSVQCTFGKIDFCCVWMCLYNSPWPVIMISGWILRSEVLFRKRFFQGYRLLFVSFSSCKWNWGNPRGNTLFDFLSTGLITIINTKPRRQTSVLSISTYSYCRKPNLWQKTRRTLYLIKLRTPQLIQDNKWALLTFRKQPKLLMIF